TASGVRVSTLNSAGTPPVPRRPALTNRSWPEPNSPGVVTVSDSGTGQGSVISPMLANVYLHYAFDLWAERWRRREATGDMIIVRYADDIVAGFEHEADARRFRDAMRERLEEVALSLH